MSSKYGYPTDAVKPGTIVRSIRFDRLGVVTDAFEEEGIIYYSCFLIPNTSSKNALNLVTGYSKNNKTGIDGLLVEESEFDLICYLMLGRVNLDNVGFYHSTPDIML
tara:strand:- start:23 stop:343 length:321 start_codon:yes stop_codon:yes gene_type:complete